MELKYNIEETAVRVCHEIAAAIECYTTVSGLDDKQMPEHFVPAYILRSLGFALTMTMETNSRALWEWNTNAKRRANGEPPLAQHPSPPAELLEKIGMQRADLVIFQGDAASKKEEMGFLCIAEYKNGWLDSKDVQKLRDWLSFIDLCPYGMVCGFVRTPANDAYLRDQKQEAEQAGDEWLLGRIGRPPGLDVNCQTFARILSNPRYQAT